MTIPGVDPDTPGAPPEGGTASRRATSPLVHEFAVDLAQISTSARRRLDGPEDEVGAEAAPDAGAAAVVTRAASAPRGAATARPANAAPEDPRDAAPDGLSRVLPRPGDVTTAELAAEYHRLRGLRVNMIASVDGAATVAGTSSALGSATDRWHMDLLRRVSDVVLVGRATLVGEGYGPLLVSATSVAWRRAAGLPDHPVLAVLSASLGLDPDAAFLHPGPGAPRPLVVTCRPAGSEPSRLERWEGRRAALAQVADVLVCAACRDTGGVDLRDARRRLAERGLERRLSEGGPSVLADLVAADAVDEICLTISPLLVGAGPERVVAGAARDATRGRGPAEAQRPLDLRGLLASGSMLLGRWAVRRTAGA